MKTTVIKSFICICAILAMAHAFSTDIFAKQRIVFGGGPSGGTFQVVAESIQEYEPVGEIREFSIRPRASAGSLENLRKVNSGEMGFGVIYSGHAFLGRNGKIQNDPKFYKNVMAVSYLYGAPAQLVVKAGAGIKSVKDLAGKRVGVGKKGSGAFANGRLFFTYMGIWNKIQQKAIGYNAAAEAFSGNQLDAFWLFTGFPSKAVAMAADNNNIALLDLDAEAMSSGFYNSYPYFVPITVPAGTYRGVEKMGTFQDSAILVANSKIPDDAVYSILSTIYTDEGLAHMKARKKTFKAMSVANGIKGIITPLHWGARKYWKEKGILK